MKKPDIYSEDMQFETKSFSLRMVSPEDTEDLLLCYSDPIAVSHMNAENCTTDFHFTTIQQMQEYMEFWIDAYKKHYFVRLAIRPKEGRQKGRAVGTVELFGGEYGVLRIDLATEYEKPDYIEEIMKLAIDRLVGLLEVQTLVIKASNVPDRVPVMRKFGFTESSFREGGYMEWKRVKRWNEKLGSAVCGLACCVCSENSSCPGCRKGGCEERSWCKGYHCWQEKKVDTCTECKEYPCDFMIIKKPKAVALNRFLKEYGEEKLLACLKRNEEQGINYHYLGEHVGDYDLPTAEEAYDLILKGWEK